MPNAAQSFVNDAQLGTSKISANFYRMVERFRNYNDEDIAAIESERLRLMLDGGREALTEPLVVRSFAVLYEDILPVRFGGDILFNLIDKSIKNARPRSGILMNKETAGQSNGVVDSTKSAAAVAKTSKYIIQSVLSCYNDIEDGEVPRFCDENLFAEIDRNGDGVLTLEEFRGWVESIPIDAANEEKARLDEWCADNLFCVIDTDNDGVLTIDEFKLWTTGSLSIEDGSAGGNNPTGCVVFSENTTSTAAGSSKPSYKTLDDVPLASPKAKKYRDRYTHMVQSFAKWEVKFEKTAAGSNANDNKNSNNRMAIVAEGCFAGAKNPGVVKALGILYEDFGPLRIAGDLIFSLMEKVATK